MSAIFGLLRFDGGKVSPRDLERMAARMAHRGPDGRKSSVDGPVGLGHCLLRVNGEDLFEAQPIDDREAGLTLVADCRIDNRDELAQAFGLGAEECRDMPDSAFIFRAYRKWGEDAAGHLLGDFTFAIWDRRAEKLVLSRDHMGQRFVHYHRGADFLAFATEVPALWALADVPRAIDDVQLGRVLVHDLKPRPGETPFRDIAQVPAGTTVVVTAAGARISAPYWQVRAGAEHLDRDEDYYIDAYRRILSEAVACRVRRLLRNPGLFLSGGYDSAAIAGLAGPAMAPGRKLVTVTSAMPEDYRGPLPSARPWVQLCARHMPHLDPRYVTREGLNIFSGADESYVAREMPFGPYDFAFKTMMEVLAAAGTRLVLDGHGGDQTLNPRGQWALAWLVSRGHWRRAWRELGALKRHSGRPLWLGLLRNVLYRLLPSRALASWNWARRGFRPIWHAHPIDRRFARMLLARGEIVPQSLAAAAKPRLRMRERQAAAIEIARADRTRDLPLLAAYCGMEFTQPFYDKRVVELGLAIPEELYFKNGRNRHLGRRALKDVYPPEFQERVQSEDDIVPDLQGMVISMGPLLQTEMARLSALPALAGRFDFHRMKRLLDRTTSHNSGRERAANILVAALLRARFVGWFTRQNK